MATLAIRTNFKCAINNRKMPRDQSRMQVEFHRFNVNLQKRRYYNGWDLYDWSARWPLTTSHGTRCKEKTHQYVDSFTSFAPYPKTSLCEHTLLQLNESTDWGYLLPSKKIYHNKDLEIASLNPGIKIKRYRQCILMILQYDIALCYYCNIHETNIHWIWSTRCAHRKQIPTLTFQEMDKEVEQLKNNSTMIH